MDIEAAFYEKYGFSPSNMSFTPYRLCPVGAHVDHQLGKITGFAIDKGIRIAYSPSADGKVYAFSLQFEKSAEWNTGEDLSKQADWADHLRGAFVALKRRFDVKRGMYCVVNGELPIGGLSSSAAVIIAFLTAFADVNGIELSSEEIIDIAREAENAFVGVSCGKLDQSCEVYCKKDALLYMDMKTGIRETVLPGVDMKPYKLAVFFSGLERSLVSSGYNMRVQECGDAAEMLLSFENTLNGRDAVLLSDVPYECYLKNKEKLPENLRKRVEHWYSENFRVEKAVEAWRNGDIETFGKICTESGKSSIENYEAGSEELKKMSEILWNTDGVYGARFSGAGFKGCCMAIINPDFEKSILEKVENEYLAAFPELKNKYCACICETANGIEVAKTPSRL